MCPSWDVTSQPPNYSQTVTADETAGMLQTAGVRQSVTNQLGSARTGTCWLGNSEHKCHEMAGYHRHVAAALASPVTRLLTPQAARRQLPSGALSGWLIALKAKPNRSREAVHGATGTTVTGAQQRVPQVPAPNKRYPHWYRHPVSWPPLVPPLVPKYPAGALQGA